MTDIFPITVGNYANINLLDGDYNGLDFIFCGSTKSSLNAINTAYESAFIQSYNKNIMVNYQLTMEMGTVQSQMAQCQFGNSNFMFLGINSKSGTNGNIANAGNFDKIYIYKYIHSSAKFINGVMLAAPGQLAVLRGMVVDKATGNSYYSG